jgi:aminopeptidase N
VIFPSPLAAGSPVSITTSYGGKDALTSQGSGNYYLTPGARDSWYPNNLEWDRTSYEMRFTVPKDFDLVASGTPDKEVVEGGQRISQWHSEAPQTTAAFQVGKFKKESKVVKGITLETYANTELPDFLKNYQLQSERMTMGTQDSGEATLVANMSTTGMAKKAMAEAELATQLYTDFFGPTAFKRLAMTQQTADNYGQSWPQLVWLPISYFLDDTQRKTLYGLDPTAYFKVVGPHEIAHQWWGHTVLWASYRDQWMSEGFADMSASLFLQATRKPADFIKFWDEERDLLVERNKEGFRAIDVGPLTQGYRLNNSRVGGDIGRRLIYPKGAYVLHMIRMAMWNPRTGDQDFKALMHGYVDAYRQRPASTEDFKGFLEKHLPPSLNLEGNGKLDWFFNEYVYGTALPRYHLDYSLKGLSLSMNVTQSGVNDQFRMLVPIYLELASGQVIRLGRVPIKGNSSEAQTVDLTQMGLKEPPRKVLLNYFDDVLCEKGS